MKERKAAAEFQHQMGDDTNLFRYTAAFSSDDMSHFFRPILARSTPQSGIPHGVPPARGDNPGWLIPPSGGLKPGIDGCDWGSSGSGGGFLGPGPGPGASCSVGGSENDTDEYECESEDHFEAVVDEAPPKPTPSRNSSKRSRAAEVHNLSEKRRRSRINEKMKALQNLIPNSNKTDKASMLDEAIEYLKQLQLQVQMLSVRNGLNLHPMCLPGVLQPPAQASHPMKSASTLSMNQDTSAQTIFSLPNQCTPSNHLAVPAHNMPSLINSKTSFGLESSIQAQFRQCQLFQSTEDICRGDVLSHHQPNMSHSKRNPSEFDMVTMSSVSFPFNAHTENVLLQNIEHNAVISSHLTSGLGVGSSPGDGIKMERRGF